MLAKQQLKLQHILVMQNTPTSPVQANYALT